MDLLGFDPETALQLQQIGLYYFARLFAGTALIGLSVHLVLVFAEMSSQRPKSQRAKAFRSARRVPVAKETRNLSLAETQILDGSEILGEDATRVSASSERTKKPIMASIFSALGAGLRRIVRGEQLVHDGSID